MRTGYNPDMANVKPANAETIAEGARILRAGGLVAFPTETVYGLGANALADRAVAEIFAVKERPRFNPLIVHVARREDAEALVAFDGRARKLTEKFWPGALTLVLPRAKDCPVSLLASAGLDTLAVRVPSHKIARALLDAARVPIAAPSANRSGEVSPTTAGHVAESLGDRVQLILDGGPCTLGLESTIVGLFEKTPLLLRPGAIAREDVEAVIGPLGSGAEGAARAPGMLESHYAPAKPLRLNARDVRAGEALLAFGPYVPQARITHNLSARGDLTEAAANFFAMLRALDRSEAGVIAVMPIPETGLGEAINDRLRRAAAPRA